MKLRMAYECHKAYLTPREVKAIQEWEARNLSRIQGKIEKSMLWRQKKQEEAVEMVKNMRNAEEADTEMIEVEDLEKETQKDD